MKRTLTAMLAALLLVFLFAGSALAAFSVEKDDYRLEVSVHDAILLEPGPVALTVRIKNDDTGWYRIRNVSIRLPDGQVLRENAIEGWSYSYKTIAMTVSDYILQQKSFTVTASYDVYQSHNDLFLEHKNESVTIDIKTAPNQFVKSVMEFTNAIFSGIGKLLLVLLVIVFFIAALGGGSDIIEIIIG